MRFWIAIAKANASRSHPRTEDSGSVNRPKLERTPKVTSPITQPAMITSVVDRRMARTVAGTVW